MQINRTDMTGMIDMLLSNQSELLRYAMQLAGDECVAWDLLQDTSVRILMHEGCYHEQGAFLPWARMVMKHIFYNRQKGLVRQSLLFDDCYPGQNDVPLAVADEGSDSYYITNEMLGMIDRLPARQSRAFHLFIDGHSYADIATAMSVSVDNVRNYIHSARVTLRRMLGR